MDAPIALLAMYELAVQKKTERSVAMVCVVLFNEVCLAKLRQHFHAFCSGDVPYFRQEWRLVDDRRVRFRNIKTIGSTVQECLRAAPTPAGVNRTPN